MFILGEEAETTCCAAVLSMSTSPTQTGRSPTMCVDALWVGVKAGNSSVGK